MLNALCIVWWKWPLRRYTSDGDNWDRQKAARYAVDDRCRRHPAALACDAAARKAGYCLSGQRPDCVGQCAAPLDDDR
jgi:hypothetical protein